jgi:hypothetical protein
MPLDLSRQVFARAPLLQEAGITELAEGEAQILDLKSLALVAPDRPAALTGILWPGVSRGPNVPGRGDETASASREPWVDANGYWIGYLRALYPRRVPMLAPVPPSDRMVPFDSHELALIEGWTSGGNTILTFDPRYREAVQRGDARALEAWRSLGTTARWLQQNVELFRQPVIPTVTALVEPGAATAEIANLLCRRNASPAIEPASNPPAPVPQRLAIVAVKLASPNEAVRRRILAHAEAGSAVVVNQWPTADLKRTRSNEDRDFYAVGRGQLIVYKGAIADPSEFALDVIDIVMHRRRSVRLWNAPSVVVRATAAPPGKGKALLHAINYGSPVTSQFPVRIQGSFTRATLLRPEASPLTLKPARRGTTTEVFLPGLRLLGVVVFE